MSKQPEDNESMKGKPHDKLVRRLLSNTMTARGLLDAYLPETVKDLLDLDCLERQPNTFIDAQHRFLEVDILFKTRCRDSHEDAFVWFLVEQQREPDIWLPLRIFCYIAVIWDHIRKSSKSRAKTVKIPFIYPLIISNASKPYPHSLTLRDMIEPESAQILFDDLFKKPIQLIDLAAISDEELRHQTQEHVQIKALLLSMKHAFDETLQSFLETSLLPYYQTLDKMGHTDDVADMLYYLYNMGNLNNESRFWSFIHQQFSHDVEEKMMTLGQQATQRAFEQGIQQDKQETALRMLEKKLDIQLIAEVTKLSQKEIRLLLKKKNH